MDLPTVLLQAHSGLRFLAMLAAVVAVAVLAWGWNARRPYAGPSRTALTVFAATLDLQLLLGVGLLLVRPFYGALMGHLLLMIAAVAIVHALAVYARKLEDARRAHAVALAGVALALALIVGGILSIRPGLFYMTPADATASAPA